LFASSWYIFLTYIYDARSHLYQIKMDLEDVLREVWGYVSQYKGFCEHCNEPSVSIKFGEVI